jgi:hypothetical protein
LISGTVHAFYQRGNVRDVLKPLDQFAQLFGARGAQRQSRAAHEFCVNVTLARKRRPLGYFNRVH